MSFVDSLWFGDTPAARFARFALAPVSSVMRAGVAVRDSLYRYGPLRSYDTAIPAISVGNLTVGGTGKTPVAAWVAAAIVERGRRPAIVLRGYGGGDEAAVHRLLTPNVPVIVDPDRVRGVSRAAAEGAQVAVLDDAFQHRRAGRVADIVLISADRWTETRRMLPAGPWREPLSAIERASLVVITRKAATEDAVERVRRAIGTTVPVAVASLPLADLVRADGEERRPLTALAGLTVHAIAAVGDSTAFFEQLTSQGARVVPHPFRDHHTFTTDEANQLAGAAGGALVVCTLKDAVKLSKCWPRQAGTLWYVSQRVEFDHGRQAIALLIDAVTQAATPS